MSIEFGKFVQNKKYGNATVTLKMEPLLFKDTFTFGVQESKFDKKKFTAALCLDDEQTTNLEKIESDILKGLVDMDIAITEVKSGLYTDKLYVKADPDLFTAYDEADEEIEFPELVKLKKYKVNAAVDVTSVFVKDGVAHLQLYFHEIVKLNEVKEKKVKRKRVAF